jgi:hypothetical protein
MPKKFDVLKAPQEDIPLYHGTIWFAKTEEEFRSLQLYLKMPLGAEPDVSGFVIESMAEGLSQAQVDRSTGYANYILGVFIPEISVVMHECGHIAMMICEHAGFDPDEASGEPYCYILGWLGSVCNKHFKPS